MAPAPVLPASLNVPFTLPFTLYSRSYCHLCDDLLAALDAMQSDAMRFTVDVVDVDADPALVERFDELVPVLFGDPGQPELCHYFLDENAVQAYVGACLRAALAEQASG